MSDIGDFYQQHRKLIDARKADLARVGITPPDATPSPEALPANAAGIVVSRPASPIAMPSQADALAMPTTADVPLIEATHKPVVPAKPPAQYETPKLPKLPGVNAKAEEE